MSVLRALTNQDRILILAPHPDDESLATGGLIQVALEAGAEVRVLYATNGDNNPWPQRVRERRIRIGAEGRRRWGRLRQAEAVAALSHLGVTRAASGMAFLGFPDQGFQSAVLEMDAAPLDALAREIGHFRPTLLVTPSLHDRHPDHNSLALIAGLALQRVGLQVERLVYLVHTNGRTPLHTRIELPLTPARQRRKREAIALHSTQMLLSRRRLLGHAGPVEVFYKPVDPQAGHANHPLASAHVSGDHIHLWMPAAELPRLPSKLFISMERLEEGGVRWVMPLPFRSGPVAVRDNLSGARVGEAFADVTERGTSIRIPLARMES
ncbi:MAG TPA: PIG-L family deacetylase, partial [Chthoniobacteraceae bacterium]|nr:PIG-L family deacetylase [Chthoniobacteraceae bacterium]